MKKITKDMIKIYEITNMDFMGYIQKKDVYSFHHIIKKQDGGKEKINNGAILLRETSHNYLHIIESRDLDMYIYLNKILKDVNNQRHLPTKEQILLMWDVLEQFELEHCADLNKKGQPLIKESFVKRKIIY